MTRVAINADRRARKRPPVSRGVWPLITPTVVVSLAVAVIPTVWALFLSVSSRGSTSITVDNYVRMFQDPLFWTSLRVTMFLFLFCLAVETIVGLALGYLLSRDVPGRRILQGVLLAPAITAPVAVGLLWILIYDPTTGIANTILKAVGLQPLAWLGDPAVAPWAIAIVDIWQWTPFMGLIVSAGIRSLPEEVFEAAAIDGASGFRKAISVGLPLLAPVLTVAMLLRSVDLVRFFDTVYVMTQGGPVNATSTLNLYGYREAFVYMDQNYASALQITLFAVVILIALIFAGVRRRFSVES